MLDPTVNLEQVIVYTPVDSTGDQRPEVSRSAGVSEPLVRMLVDGSLQRTQLITTSPETLRFFPVIEGQFALSRSMVGRVSHLPGRRLIISRIVLFRHDQLARFRNHLGQVLFLLRTSGFLTIPLEYQEQLSELTLPVPIDFGWNSQQPILSEAILEKTLDALQIHHQVALTGVTHVAQTLAQLFDQMSIERRLDLSFSTGLQVDPSHQFALQLFADSDASRNQELNRCGRRVVSVKQNQGVAGSFSY